MPVVLRFYPVGNGNSVQIILDNGKRLIFDFRQVKGGSEEDFPVIDLDAQLRRELRAAKQDDVDVLIFSHGDKDHVAGAADFFFLDHAAVYQKGDRIKFKELWVPAAFILEEDVPDDFRPLRQEARHRLKKGYGIRVFSRPDRLDQWLRDQGINPATRAHLITDAGNLVPGFTKAVDQVEFFVHAPFMKHVDGKEDVARNEAALILHATFLVEGTTTRGFLIGDTEAEALEDIVDITRYHKREERLVYDFYPTPHHMSHNALSPERGKTVTVPLPKVADLLNQGRTGALLISSSIPVGTDLERKLPPHVQAKNAYDAVAKEKKGAVLVTGDSKDKKGNPIPIDIEITGDGCKRKLEPISTAAIVMSSRPAPRAG